MIASIDLRSLFKPAALEIGLGVVATGPLVVMLMWIMASRWRPIEAFRTSQLRFFREIGFRLTPLRSALLSLAAGVGEELLFRGVLQTSAARYWPIAVAIVIPNVLFGALHARTAAYAVAAGLVGVYLGALYWLTAGLTAPIVAHALYDFIALEWARRIIARTPPVSDAPQRLAAPP